MKKEEYIERHGEEAWAELLEKRREYKRNNKEKIKEQNKKYRAEHKEQRKAYNKEYIAKDREKWNEYARNWQRKHYNEIRERRKVYKENHKEDIKRRQEDWISRNPDYHKNYQQTQKHRANRLRFNYKRHDEKDNRHGFNISKEFILENIFKSNCVYCGDNNWRHLGCDRIDNDKAHYPENVVCSCEICNIERQNKRMSVEEFIEYRKTHTRDDEPQKLQEVVEINGIKVIRKVL